MQQMSFSFLKMWKKVLLQYFFFWKTDWNFLLAIFTFHILQNYVNGHKKTQKKKTTTKLKNQAVQLGCLGSLFGLV